MSKYVFLDNWVLSDYTKPDRLPYLSDYIKNNHLTVIIDSLSLTELYNPGCANASGDDRTSRATTFISKHSTIIVDPIQLIRAEIQNYPDPVQSLPVELDLKNMSEEDRKQSLAQFLHHDTSFLQQGKDIRTWANSYEKAKSEWLDSIEKIIDHAVQAGALTRDKTGHFRQSEEEREAFLVTLDRRHFSYFDDREREQLATKVVELFMGATSKLPATRATSLYFWYAYLQIDKTHPISRAPSDLGDFYQMSLIPYCEVFTTDNKMQWLSQRIADETSSNSCKVLNKANLDREIGFNS
jgi:hypothetical protein